MISRILVLFSTYCFLISFIIFIYRFFFSFATFLHCCEFLLLFFWLLVRLVGIYAWPVRPVVFGSGVETPRILSPLRVRPSLTLCLRFVRADSSEPVDAYRCDLSLLVCLCRVQSSVCSLDASQSRTASLFVDTAFFIARQGCRNCLVSFCPLWHS